MAQVLGERRSVRRFFYVGTAGRHIVHRCYSNKHVEGERTACGRIVKAGSPYWYGRRSLPKLHRICQSCERGE